MKTVYYLQPSSFCFGVKRSIDQLNSIVQEHPGAKIFCIHALVHNPKVTKEFENKGITFVETIDEIQEKDAIIIFSAHGTQRKIIEEARVKYKKIYNLECPFVSKIYTEIDNFLQKGIRKFIYIGKEHHQEGGNVIANIRNAGAQVCVYEQGCTIEAIPYDKEGTYAVISQTTLNFDHVQNIFKEIKKQYPHALFPSSCDVCKATYERQSVITQHINTFETLVVIGGKESSNTRELAQIGRENNKQTLYGESLEDILQYPQEEIFAHDTVAITGGASTPIEDIRAVFDYYKNHGYEPKILQLY